MLTEFTDAIYRELLSRVPGGQPIPRTRLHNPDFPGVIAHFLEHALDRRLELESRRAVDLGSEWVDHSLEEVRLARAAYLRVLGRYSHFPTGEWPRALRQAVQLTGAYLVRPVPTLIHFIFGEDDSALDAADVLRRAGYFTGYGHLSAAIEEVVSRNPDQPARRRGLTEALELVDRRVSSEYQLEDWERNLSPLFQLATLVDEKNGVPIEVLVSFFEHKNAHALSARIRQFGRGHGKSGLTEDQLIEALEDKPEPAPVASDHPSGPADPPPSQAPIAAAATPLSQEPLWKRFQTPAQPTSAAPKTDTPLWQRFRNPADASSETIGSAAPLPADPWIEVTGRRAYFVRNLFGGNDRAFDDVLERLEQTTDWPSASRFLGESVFRQHHIDIYSDAAIAFTNAVERRFAR